jgi:hypothetical protein
MKVYKVNDTGEALCHRDGRVKTTFAYRDMPFRDGKGVVKDILVGVCDVCGDAVVIPAQSGPAVAATRERVENSFEVSLPAIYLELLDAAASRISGSVTSDFRKRLLIYYVNRYASGLERVGELRGLTNAAWNTFTRGQGMPNKRLSMKLNDIATARIAKIVDRTRLSKTELVKSIVAKIYADIVEPAKPKHLSELITIADVIYA